MFDRKEWIQFEEDVQKASQFRALASTSFAFQFVQGTLLKALKHGYWLFLDEINLAPPEALQSLAAVLDSGPQVSLNLGDRGSVSVPKHPHFRLIGAMNPATDFGKRDLAACLRNKLTEFWFSEPDLKEDLETMVAGVLSHLAHALPISRIVDFYLSIKEEAKGGLTDGAGLSPCYSLRTLRRFLEYVQKMIGSYGVHRSLWDGASTAFCTQLDASSRSKMHRIIREHLLTEKLNEKQLFKVPKAPPGKMVLIGQFWLDAGPEEIPDDACSSGKQFVLTPSIQSNLQNLARAVALR